MRTGPTPGQVFELSANEMTLGREPGNEITINDAEISRKHARLSLQAGTYMLEDLGSTNGTFVNGQRLMGPHALRAGRSSHSVSRSAARSRPSARRTPMRPSSPARA
jgi:pSer/pThr/pTyr-binding forkhead associated (FHA) protein